MNGMPAATALDVERYRTVGTAPDPDQFPHALRWFKHIEALLTTLPHTIDYQQNSSALVDPSASASAASAGQSISSSAVSVDQTMPGADAEKGPRGGKKLKILALHGLGQCKETFAESQQKKDCLAKKLGHIAELVYVDAPRPDPRPANCCFRVYYEPQEFHLGDTLAWQTMQQATCLHIEDSLAKVQDIWRNHPEGPFDGVLGFSSGASFGACFVDYMQRQEGPRPRFIICCSGSYTPVPMNLPEYAAYMTSGEKIMVPSFHTIGKEDDICLPELSRKLASIFHDAQVLEFEGGKHRPPNKSADCAHIVTFLSQFL
jgi:predicted esterase